MSEKAKRMVAGRQIEFENGRAYACSSPVLNPSEQYYVYIFDVTGGAISKEPYVYINLVDFEDAQAFIDDFNCQAIVLMVALLEVVGTYIDKRCTSERLFLNKFDNYRKIRGRQSRPLGGPYCR